MNRIQEIRQLLALTPEQMIRKAAGRLVITPDLDALHRHFAQEIFREIQENNRAGRPTRLILPVGPAGQFPILREMIHRERLSLKSCHFFFMDEYYDETAGAAVPPHHCLSLRGEAWCLFFDGFDPALAIPQDQLVFPNEKNIGHLAARIQAAGGIDTCYGGVGIHGHVAFNEPEPGVGDSDPRIVALNDFTVTINAIRDGVGGNLEAFPRKALTLGMRQILGARRIRLYVRNGVPYDWANTVLRLALFGKPGDDYPVTLIRRHEDYLIATDAHTAAVPKHIL